MKARQKKTRIKFLMQILVFLITFTILVLIISGANVFAKVILSPGQKPQRILSQCSDHIDNDKDGYCDFSWKKGYCSDGSALGDPNCASKDDNDESPSCTIACSSDAACGSVAYSAPYCAATGNVYRDATTPACYNSGTCNSYCASSVAPVLHEICMNGCENGACLPQNVTAGSLKQVIFVGVDGMQYAHYKNMLSANRLLHITEMINAGGWSGNATITGHSRTETAPGNAELHSGLPDSATGITDNTCGRIMASGTSVFERLHKFNSAIHLGLVYGKGTCYIPDAILNNAKPMVEFWHNRTTYSQTTWVSSNCADSRNVATKALEFVNLHKGEPFYLVVYFGAPDCSGHTYGENTPQYDDAIINVDDGIGVLRAGLLNSGILNDVKIIMGGDHGWNEGATGHGTANIDTQTIPLLSSNSSFVGRIYSQEKRKQCDIAPTILNYFGMSPSNYQQITDNGCGSMIL